MKSIKLHTKCGSVMIWAAMKEYRLGLAVPADEMLGYYGGYAQYAVVTTVDGIRIRLPAYLLRPYMTQTGINGEFLLRCDERNRFISLEKL